MEQSWEYFHKWETNFIKIIQSKRYIDRETDSEFRNFIRNIELSNSLPPPYEKQTNHFLNIFSPQIIIFILEIHSISKEIENEYQSILQQYSQILGQQLTVINDTNESINNEPFIQAASKIIESKNSNFYLLSEKSKTNNAKHLDNYLNNCHAFATTANLDLFIEFVQNPILKSLSKIETIIQIIFPIFQLFDKEKLNYFVQIVSSKIWKLVSNKNPREMNITKNEETLISLEKMATSPTTKSDIWKVQIDFSIKILKSGILTNQFSSLSTICRICQESPEQISPILRDANLLNYLLLKPNKSTEKIDYDESEKVNNNDNIKITNKQSFFVDNIHFELINYIADIFSSMYICKCATDDQLKTLWLKSISQSQTTIGTFLKAMGNILSKISKESFFNMIIETNRFPDSILPFLQSISSQCPPQLKVSMFNKLHDFFFSDKKFSTETEDILIQTMLTYILDSDPNFCNKLQEECLIFIKSDSHINYSLKILQNTLLLMTSEKAHDAFNTIMNKVNKDSIEYLDLIAKVVRKFDSQINQDDFLVLQEKTNKMIPDHSKNVCVFYQELLDSKQSKAILSNQIILAIYNNFCSLPYNANIFEMIKKLYNILKSISLNETSNSFVEIIDSIWNHLFVTNQPEVSSFLIHIYTTLKDHNKAQKFISNCLKNLHCVGSLEAIKDIIHVMEDGINSDKIRQQNRMIFSFDLCTVNLIYLNNKPYQMKVTKDICYEGFKRIVIQTLDLKQQQTKINTNQNPYSKNQKQTFFIVLLYDNSVLFNHDNFKLYDGINVSIHVTESNTNENFDFYDRNDILPSEVLTQSDFYSPIFDILLENDDKLSPIALNIFNIIPTLASQITEINSIISTKEDKNTLENFLSKNHPYLLIYRAHIIGNIALKNSNNDTDIKYLDINCNEFLNCFYQSDGIEYLLKIIFNFSSLSFPNNSCMNDLLRITKYLLLYPHFHEITIKSIEKVKDNIESFIQWTIKVANDNNDLLLTDITLFMKELTNYIIDFDSFSEVVKITIFHKLPEIRTNIFNIVDSIDSISTREKLIVPLLLKDAKTSKCYEYFNLLTNIAKLTENPFNLYTEVTTALYENFKLPDKGTTLDILLFIPPSINYAHGIFKTLNILIGRLISDDSNNSELKVEDAEKLVKFLTNEIIFNPYKYYLPTDDLFDAYLALLDKFNQFILLLEPIVKMVEDFKLSSKSNSSLSATARNRGIKNLGATCYINSTIQQLFNIREFIRKILSANADEINQTETQNKQENQEKEKTLDKENQDKEETLDKEENQDNKETLDKENQDKEETLDKENQDNKETLDRENQDNKETLDRENQDGKETRIKKENQDEQESNSEQNRKDSSSKLVKDWFSELQYDLAKLWLFPSNFINISDFVSSWSGYDNEPINPHVQQDSAEFLQLLIDRLETKIPGISSIFTGKIEHRIVGVSVPYERTNSETFVIFPLEVKNLTTFSESFSSFLQPDRFECNDEELGKFDALLYHHITQAPKILIIQLKRFNYNLMTREREKINSFYKFTLELDLSPLIENAKEKVIYDLCGIVQHQGSANSGHYFSDVLRESGKWLCLNDNKCTKVNGEDLPLEAAGGTEERTIYDEKTKTSRKETIEKSTNAYILFYRIREEENSKDINEKEPIEMNQETMNRLLPAIQKTILEAVCSSANFSKLVLKICENGQNNEFLYKYTLNAMRICNDKSATEIMIAKCIGICTSSQQFSDFILSRERDCSEFIIFMKFSKIRRYFVSILEAALSNCSKKAHLQFYRYLFDQISSSNQVIYERKQCLPEFFEVVDLTVINDKEDKNIDTKELLKIILTFVTDSIHLYDTKHKNENIFNKINLANAFNLMLNLCNEISDKNKKETETIKIKIASKMIKSPIFTALINSTNHCSNLASLLEFALLNNNQAMKLFLSYLNENKKYISIQSIAVLLNLSMTISDQDLIDFFFELIKTKNSIDIVLFFQILEPICHSNRNIFMFNAQVWIKLFLLSSNISVRAAVVNFIYKMFSNVIEDKTKNANDIENENAKGVIINIYQNLIDSVPLLIQSISNLKKKSLMMPISEDNVPTQEYFEILTWSAEMVQMKDKNDIQVFVSFIQTLDELLRNIPNVSASVSQFHCLQYLVKLYGKQLFAASSSVSPASVVNPLNNSCKLINRQHEEVLVFINNLLIFVLPRYCICYLKSKLFSFLLMNSFNLEASNFVKENLNGNTVRLITTVLWNQSVLKRNCNKKSNNLLYLQTSWKIIKEYNETCDIIYDQQDFLVLLQIINKNSPILRAAAKFLAEFNFAYEMINRNKKFIISLKTQALYKKYKENGFNWKTIYELAYNNRQMISPGNGGLCQFMRSMIALKTNPPQHLLSLISKSPKTFITTVIPTVHAAHLVCDLCVAFPDSGEAINCLIREFSSISSCFKVVDIFCQAFAKMKRKNFWMDLKEPLKKIFLKSDDIEVAGETVLRMSEQLFEKSTLIEFRSKVLLLMIEEIRRVIAELASTTSTKIMRNEYNKLKTGYDFINDISSTIGDRTLPQLDISREESQKIIEIFKEHKFFMTSDSFYLYLVKK